MMAPAEKDAQSGSVETEPAQARGVPASPAVVAWEALKSVYDPELCLDVVSLGLVYDVYEKPGKVIIEMTLTTPGCPVSESLPQEARAAVCAAVDPRIGVEVEVVWDPPWSPAMLHEDAATALGFRKG